MAEFTTPFICIRIRMLILGIMFTLLCQRRQSKNGIETLKKVLAGNTIRQI